MNQILLRAYATIPEFLKSITGWEWIPNIPINTYGTFVALGFLTAAVIAYRGLKDRGNLGLLKGYAEVQIVGEAPKISDFITPFITWFIIGFKVLGALIHDPSRMAQGQKTVKYLLSIEGYWVWGLVTALLACLYTYYTINKEKLPEPKKETVQVEPQDMIGEIVGVAAVFGVVGASVFEIIQPGSQMTLKELFSDPMNFLSGLTILGGLTFGIIGVFLYAGKRKLKPFQLFDSIAPGYILAYGVGRLGCHFSGDGDWGKVNLSEAPAFIPDSWWSNTYAHNVINAGTVKIEGCVGNYCNELAQGVWPTSIYEVLMCIVMFAIMWSFRKKVIYAPGFMFCVLLVFNGIERFLIEIIRVTDTYPAFFNLTQAQIISVFMVLAGTAGIIYLYKKYQKEIDASSFTELVKSVPVN